MTVDSLLAIALNVAIPSLLAILGGVLAVRSLPISKTSERVWWISLFVGLALIAIVMAFIQQVRITGQQNLADQKAAQDEAALRADNASIRADGKYTQGQLDSINKVLTAVVSGKPGTDQFKALTAALLKKL